MTLAMRIISLVIACVTTWCASQMYKRLSRLQRKRKRNNPKNGDATITYRPGF